VVSQIQGVTIVSFRDSSILDGIAVDAIGSDLYALIDEQARRKVLLDFSQVRFLSSTMMGVLLALHKKSSRIDGKIVICGLQRNLLKAFKVMRLDKLLELTDTEQEGIGRFSPLGRD